MSISKPAKADFSEVLHAAGQLRRQLADHGVTGGLTIFGGGNEPTVVACTFDFDNVSISPGAQKIIGNLEAQGCGCASLPDDGVRCSCPD